MLMTTIAIVAVLGGLIFFHELGHFAAARSLGMGVSAFSLGFGPKILKRKAGKTEYALSLIPLGGYVALVGETDPKDMPEGFTEEENFALRPAWQRLVVVAAGPLANMLLALLLCWTLAFGWGAQILLPEVGDVNESSPATTAGIKKGDHILAVNGSPIESWEQLSAAIAGSGGAPLRFEIARSQPDKQQALVTLSLTPAQSVRKSIFGEEETVWIIGVRAAGTTVTKSLDFAESVLAGARQAYTMLRLTWQGLVKLVQRVVPLDQVGGPIMIAQMVGEQAHQGLAGLLALTALISVNLGILNLLPIPVLDGGQILFFILELLFRRPLNEKFREYAMRAGIAALICLMLLATFNDVWRLIKSAG
ncbi:MAG: putative membrane-associated zinc metalloprotease [Candidatus Desulfovibrio kirbyi]|uniref:Zinc metalloprotease n=1 Tax=Candidatus Desulfovibrio kirbyi TaxID=2696086 RepID=A0A6L2R493_9BACT|nr:MAG: putative membrane-associated zinc metalloprotease [Candidatus Desulfovibrio kirbyi]